MTFSRDEEVLMMLYSPGTKSGLVKALRKMSADLDLDDPEDNQLYQLTDWIFLGAPSYTGVCSIPVHRLDESIRISDNMISTDVPFVDGNRLSLQTDITGGRQWQRKRKNSRAGPALQGSRGQIWCRRPFVIQ